MILTEQQKRLLVVAEIPRQVVTYLASKPAALPTAKYMKRVALALGYKSSDDMIDDNGRKAGAA